MIILLLFVVTATVDKNRGWEPSENIRVSIGTFTGNLSEAISNRADDLRAPSQTQNAFVTDGRSHRFGDVYVSVNGLGMNLKDAINNTDLCGILNTTINYANAPDPSHLGTEIEVTSPYDGKIKSLQDTINDGSLVSVDGGWTNWTNCTADYQKRTCTNPSQFCAGNECQRIDSSFTNVSNNTETRFCGSWLYRANNNPHSEYDCGQAGGNVVLIGPAEIKLCELSKNSCPSGWTEYQHHYGATTCSGGTISGPFCESHSPCRGRSCTTGSRWAKKGDNNAPKCSYAEPTYREIGECNWYCGLSYQTCTAGINKVRCY